MKRNFALFFTRGVSLKKWAEIGMLEREIKPYQKLAEYFENIYLFTYGGVEDKKYQLLFPENVFILVKPRLIPVLLYSFILPFVHRKVLKNTQIIKTNQMDGSWSAVIAKKLYGVKLVIRCGYEWLQTIEKSNGIFLKKWIGYIVEKYSYNNADRIISTSEESKNFVTSRFKHNANKIELIQNFVDTDVFKPMSLEKKENRIIFVGRLEKEKNLGNLFKALVGLKVNLVVIGNGSLRSELESLASDLKMKVEFMGNMPQSALPTELNKSAIFILPSLYEGNPKVLLEAMSCGVACVGADIPGISSVISDGSNGVLCDTDEEGIREAVVRLLEDRKLCANLGKLAREKIILVNSLPIFLAKELAIYQSL